MTSVLQPFDTDVGCLFKAAFRRLLVNHVLQYMKKLNGKPCKVNKSVTIYDGVRLMANAWDLSLRSAVFNSWIKTGIFVPFQTYDVKDKGYRKTHRSKRTANGSVF